eukprot:PhF_6_TR15991/c1_g1_i1/m.25095
MPSTIPSALPLALVGMRTPRTAHLKWFPSPLATSRPVTSSPLPERTSPQTVFKSLSPLDLNPATSPNALRLAFLAKSVLFPTVVRWLMSRLLESVQLAETLKSSAL